MTARADRTAALLGVPQAPNSRSPREAEVAALVARSSVRQPVG